MSSAQSEMSDATHERHAKLIHSIFPEIEKIVQIENKLEEVLKLFSRFSSWAKAVELDHAVCEQIIQFQEEHLLRVRNISKQYQESNKKLGEMRGARKVEILNMGKAMPDATRDMDWEHDTDIEETFGKKINLEPSIAEHEERFRKAENGLLYEMLLQVRFLEVAECFPRIFDYPVSVSLWAVIVTKKKRMGNNFKFTKELAEETVTKASQMMMKAVIDADTEELARELELQNMCSGHRAMDSVPDQPAVAAATRGGKDVAPGLSASDGLVISMVSSTITCFYCGKIGHFEENCWDLHPELRQESCKARSTPWCTYCTRTGHWRKYCRDRHPEIRPKVRGSTSGWN